MSDNAWRYVKKPLAPRAALADPAQTAARRGREQRAKTDDSDCELQLRPLLAGDRGRPHSSLADRPPINRVQNVCREHI